MPPSTGGLTLDDDCAPVLMFSPFMKILTHSRMAAYRGCPRMHFYRYVLLRRAIRVAHALRFGTLIHLCLEMYWRARMAKQDALTQALSPITSELDLIDAARARAMILCYVALWELKPYEVLAVEKKFVFPLVHPDTGEVSDRWQVSGKIDLILKDPESLIHLGEHKTTSDEAAPGGGYRQRLLMDPQISQYFLGAAAIGFDAVNLIYDVLKKPKQQPLQATPADKRKYTKAGVLYAAQRERDETPDEYENRVIDAMIQAPDEHILRLDCHRSEDSKRQYALNIWEWADRIDRDKTHPQNEDHCWKYNTPCEYWEVCCGITSIDNPIRFRTATSQHEELEEHV